MVKSTVIEALAFMRERLEEDVLRVAKIILFGSYAREQATEESDIDVAIISDDFMDKDIFERAKLTQDPEILTIRKYMIPLDIITLTPEEYEKGSSLISLLARDGKIVYAA
jgi:predicted nucleotidyltransferase